MFLVNLFEKFSQVRWKWTEKKNFEWTAIFYVEDIAYTVSLFLFDSPTDSWELSFTAASGDTDFGFNPTGTGNAFAVLGTVIQIAKAFLALKQPNCIKIESDIWPRSRFLVNWRIASAISHGTDYVSEKNEHKEIFIKKSEQQNESILEDAQNDLLMGNMAHDLSYDVSRAIYSGKKPDHHVECTSSGQEFLVYDPQSVGLDEYPDLALMFALRKPNTAGSVSAAVCKFDPMLFGKYSHGMIFYGLRDMTYGEVKIMVGGTAFIDAFAHEMIHHLDAIRSDDKMPNSSSDNKARYYNNDSEFNAYYHDIVRNLTGAINEIKKGEEKPADIMDLYSLTGDFKTDIVKILKPNGTHERMFLKWLRNSKRKALIKRIYKLYDELTKQVKQDKKSPVSESILPMDTASRMQRAKELGFTVRAYHGTGNKFKEFDIEKGRPNVLSGHAPHFADSKAEAQGYADTANDPEEHKAGRTDGSGKVRVLDCLLRVKNPFVVDYDKKLSRAEFEKIVGRLPIKDRFVEKPQIDTYRLTTKGAIHEMTTMYGYERDQYADRKAMWTIIYKRLRDAGYDALYFPETPADHSRLNYNKIVILDPKNVRSIKAKFDPAQSNSANLMA
jgi:hypothetical protein